MARPIDTLVRSAHAQQGRRFPNASLRERQAVASGQDVLLSPGRNFPMGASGRLHCPLDEWNFYPLYGNYEGSDAREFSAGVIGL